MAMSVIQIVLICLLFVCFALSVVNLALPASNWDFILKNGLRDDDRDLKLALQGLPSRKYTRFIPTVPQYLYEGLVRLQIAVGTIAILIYGFVLFVFLGNWPSPEDWARNFFRNGVSFLLMIPPLLSIGGIAVTGNKKQSSAHFDITDPPWYSVPEQSRFIWETWACEVSSSNEVRDYHGGSIYGMKARMGKQCQVARAAFYLYIPLIVIGSLAFFVAHRAMWGREPLKQMKRAMVGQKPNDGWLRQRKEVHHVSEAVSQIAV